MKRIDDDAMDHAYDADVDANGVRNGLDVCDFTPAGIDVQADGGLRADLNGDCHVDLADFAIMQAEFTGPPSP